MKKLLLFFFIIVGISNAQVTTTLPITTSIDTLDRFTTYYKPSQPTTLRQIAFKTVRDYFWTRLNRWTGINYYDSTVVFRDSVIANKSFDLSNRSNADTSKHSVFILPHRLEVNRIGSFGYQSVLYNDSTWYRPIFIRANGRKDTLAYLSDIQVGGGTVGGWTLSNTTPKKLYQNTGIKTHIRLSAGDTTQTALFNVYGTSDFKGIPTFQDDSLKINGLYYDFPSTRFAGSVPYDSLGNGVLVWRHSPVFLDKANTFTNTNTFNSILQFGASGEFVLPTADPYPNVGRLFRSTDVLKFTNSAGDRVTVANGTGTANQIAYWSATNTLGALTTASYPSLTELSYVKGVSSAIQTQFTGKLSTSLTSANIFVGNGSNIATGVAMSGDASISNTGSVTVADDSHAHTGTTISGLAVADFTSPNISNWTNDSGYLTASTGVTLGTNQTITGGKSFYSYLNFTSTGTLSMPTLATTTKGDIWYKEDGTFTVGEYRGYNVNGAFSFIRDNATYSNPAWVASLSENKISFTDITTGNASTTKHGYLPKLNNSATQFLNGQGNWASVTATSATNLAGGSAYYIPYQSSPNTTTFLAPSGTSSALTYTSGGGLGWLTYTNANTVSTMVWRDASGNFSAGTITATLNGNASTATSATSATSATTATNLAGGANNRLAYQTGSGTTGFIAAPTGLSQVLNFTSGLGTIGWLDYTNNNTASTLVWRNASGDFSAGTITATLSGNASTVTNGVYTNANNVLTGSFSTTPDNISWSTSISAANRKTITAGGSSAQTTTTISDGVDGQEIILMNTSSSFNWTLNETGNINLAGTSDYVMGQYDTITLIYYSSASKWIETSRSNN